MKQPVSIFNDVIGPIMVGPSSSHTAGAARIGKIARHLAANKVKNVVIIFDPEGSFAATYKGQRSDKGFIGGLLGWNPDNEDLVRAIEAAEENRISVRFEKGSLKVDHPNTVKIIIVDDTGKRSDVVAISLGGGMIQITEVEQDTVKAMLAAGIIGVFIAEQATFAAEQCGCQAECGSASAMAAAGLVQLGEGSAKQAVWAASFALQNSLSLICDPVAERVEVPCVGRNVSAVANAMVSANLALGGFDPVIPLDEVIRAMYSVGTMLPSELRCTGKGGLCTTPTAERLKKNNLPK